MATQFVCRVGLNFKKITNIKQTEELVLAKIIKKDGLLSIKNSKSANMFEVFGFLVCYLDQLQEELQSSFESDNDYELY